MAGYLPSDFIKNLEKRTPNPKKQANSYSSVPSSLTLSRKKTNRQALALAFRRAISWLVLNPNDRLCNGGANIPTSSLVQVRLVLTLARSWPPRASSLCLAAVSRDGGRGPVENGQEEPASPQDKTSTVFTPRGREKVSKGREIVRRLPCYNAPVHTISSLLAGHSAKQVSSRCNLPRPRRTATIAGL